MTTVVGLALWCLLAAGGWWLAGRVQLLLNYAEELLAMGAKGRHPAGNAEVQPATCTCQQCGADCATCPLCGPTLAPPVLPAHVGFAPDPEPTPFPRGKHRTS